MMWLDSKNNDFAAVHSPLLSEEAITKVGFAVTNSLNGRRFGTLSEICGSFAEFFCKTVT